MTRKQMQKYENTYILRGRKKHGGKISWCNSHVYDVCVAFADEFCFRRIVVVVIFFFFLVGTRSM